MAIEDISQIKGLISSSHGGDVNQLEAIFSKEKRILLEAPAGCGKTKTMVSKAAYIIATGELGKNKKILDFTNLIFQKLGLGIDNVSVNEEDYESWASKHQMLSLPLASKDRRNGVISLFHNQTQAYTVIKNKVYSFLFKQRGEDGYVGDLDAISQSDGTIKLLTLLPAIYDCINKDKTVVIDEINNCLHPSIVEGIVGLFANNDNSKGQLVFTTHDIELLDVKDIMRSDEIWFTDKKDGGTIMYSHNIFKEHNTLSILRGYKEGRFGAIKYID